MSAELALANQIKSYGMRVIPNSDFDSNTMIDVTDDVEYILITNNVVIDGNTTTLLDISNYADTSAISASGTFTSDPTYGVTWGQHVWPDSSLDLTIEDTNISEIEIEWSGLLGSNALGQMILNIDNVQNSIMSDAWASDSTGQSYTRNNVVIQVEQVTEILNDRFIISGLNASKIDLSIFYLDGYNKSPRYINYLSYKTEKGGTPINTTSIHDIFKDGSAIATYQLNNNANDLGGTYNGTEDTVTYNVGKFGNAAIANGSDECINLDAHSENIVSGSSVFTISGWAKFNTIKESAFISFGGSSNGMAIGILGNGTSLVGLENNDTLVQITGSTIIVSEWNHFLMTYNPNTPFCEFFLNGISQNSSASTFTNGSNPDTIGGSEHQSPLSGGASTSIVMNGMIDQVRIFNKVLTNDELLELYNEGNLHAVLPIH